MKGIDANATSKGGRDSKVKNNGPLCGPPQASLSALLPRDADECDVIQYLTIVQNKRYLIR